MAAPPPCPCESGLSYDSCCEPLHRGARAADPVALMRSRYSAYARGEAEYLWYTLHPQHEERRQKESAWLATLRRSIKQTRYLGLSILDSRVGSDEGQVLFLARLAIGGKDRAFVELSTFLLEPEGWRYYDGDGLPAAELGRTTVGLDIAAFQKLFAARKR